MGERIKSQAFRKSLVKLPQTFTDAHLFLLRRTESLSWKLYKLCILHDRHKAGMIGLKTDSTPIGTTQAVSL